MLNRRIMCIQLGSFLIKLIFCEGLFKRKFNEISKGYDGITTIINYFLESIEIKFSQPDQLDYDVKLKSIKYVINKILDKLALSGKDHITYDEADTIVNSEFSSKCSKKEYYLKILISEGLLNADLYWSANGTHYDGINFAYQRFQDHLTVSLLLDKYLNRKYPAK